MTTACAWCDSVQSVDLVALCRSGLSHGVCVTCMPRAFGREAAKQYLAIVPELAADVYEKAGELGHSTRTFPRFNSDMLQGAANHGK